MRQKKIRTTAILAGGLALGGLFASGSALAIDGEGAQMLARQSGCFKCHAIDHKKEAPAWRDVAAKYQGNAGAEAKLIHHITSGERVKFEDGHEEDHKIVKTSPPKDMAQVKNLVDWILSL